MSLPTVFFWKEAEQNLKMSLCTQWLNGFTKMTPRQSLWNCFHVFMCSKLKTKSVSVDIICSKFYFFSFLYWCHKFPEFCFVLYFRMIVCIWVNFLREQKEMLVQVIMLHRKTFENQYGYKKQIISFLNSPSCYQLFTFKKVIRQARRLINTTFLFFLHQKE